LRLDRPGTGESTGERRVQSFADRVAEGLVATDIAATRS
jgi:hypothetical protein